MSKIRFGCARPVHIQRKNRVKMENFIFSLDARQTYGIIVLVHVIYTNMISTELNLFLPSSNVNSRDCWYRSSLGTGAL